ncbi:hypothetical protein HOLleu_13650 [Holothuria leucospilota]|uniref:Uncharacterized protein n=1 Tax=Holothuria leucospilota TaxID=206669 RepID=A0A9Q1CDJ7_HOLLE|nr:hypothetical protein HOLleu_13650 [Holothuria leucospilota]
MHYQPLDQTRQILIKGFETKVLGLQQPYILIEYFSSSFKWRKPKLRGNMTLCYGVRATILTESPLKLQRSSDPRSGYFPVDAAQEWKDDQHTIYLDTMLTVAEELPVSDVPLLCDHFRFSDSIKNRIVSSTNPPLAFINTCRQKQIVTCTDVRKLGEAFLDLGFKQLERIVQNYETL